jgi:YD repeat-containing protein
MRIWYSRALAIAAAAALFASQSAAQTITYTYDSLGRVTSESSSTGPSTTYAYDPADNRSRVTMSTGPNAPGAVNDSASTYDNTPLTVSVLSNDVSPLGYTLTVSSAAGASHGTTLVQSGTTIKYTPSTNYIGNDAFTYSISDGHGGTATATVSVVVNSAVTANDDSSSGGITQTVAVLANDSDALSYPLTVTSVTTPTNGATATIVSGTTVRVGNMGIAGYTEFQYTVSDGHGGVATANVSATWH